MNEPRTGPSDTPDLGTPLGLIPDEDLLALANEIVVKRESGGELTKYVLDELGRREQARQTATMVRLTQIITVLTVVITVLTAASLAAVIIGG